jgi:hypothetical protein
MRFGRLQHDPDTLARAPSLRLSAVEPPAVLDRSSVNVNLGLYQNDVYPDCTAAGAFNYVCCIAALNGYGLPIDNTKAPTFYAACIGCADTPEAIAATDGALMTDVIARLGSHGLDIGSQTLVGFGGTIPLRRIQLALSLAQVGAGYWGIDVYQNDMDNVGKVWTTDYSPGPVEGGHCVVGFDYAGLGNNDVVRIATWGAWQMATWAWVDARLQEAHGLAFRDLTPASGKYWSGVTYDTLLAEAGVSPVTV